VRVVAGDSPLFSFPISETKETNSESTEIQKEKRRKK